MSEATILYAPRVHVGGGWVLLRELLGSVREFGLLLLDHRVAAEIGSSNLVRYLPSGWRSYIVGELLLRRFAHEHPSRPVLCFSSLPPFFRLRNPTAVFVQNRFVVDTLAGVRFPFGRRWRLRVERWWFRRSVGNADLFLVQTDSMRELLVARHPGIQVLVAPFLDRLEPRSKTPAQPELDFIYVATPDPHKNHGVLLEAWKELAREGQTPSLGLTVPEEEPLGIWTVARLLNEKYGTRISRLDPPPDGWRGHYYRSAKALIFPSRMETYGLPLVEAARFGLKILASELDYVRDSVEPAQTFDPCSPVSVARAVKRFLGIADPRPSPMNAAAFFDVVNSGLLSLPTAIESRGSSSASSPLQDDPGLEDPHART